ncbi:putative membrane protein [Janthinobacterium agaricidamnosum NBRC 102515 = DSM 9628]|uniref:Putative membrane protein n=1 Tax=Janthinobacterium agaricidamnosum NBRC 102515 = DSM 9628 TaxID=1349767 RepID=W0V4X5_9BURK|nr:putative membrane protein [Janthinobacterium agaricidamnosum NBRC 102515 = DSM 9628]
MANDASPNTDLGKNPIAIFLLILLILSFILIFIPKIYKWNWETKYFGVGIFEIGSISLFGITPTLCLLVYSDLSLKSRTAIFLIYTLQIFFWCKRFSKFYKKIYENPDLRKKIYVEEDDANYYMQKGDRWLIDKKFKFKQLPSNLYFLLSIFFAIAIIPFSHDIIKITKLPFIYTFCAIAALPISLLGCGLITRSWLIFYYYPKKIKAKNKKPVYVDMNG